MRPSFLDFSSLSPLYCIAKSAKQPTWHHIKLNDMEIILVTALGLPLKHGELQVTLNFEKQNYMYLRGENDIASVLSRFT
jgi:hypothetical protein